jgi:transposase-like protein
MLSTVPRRCTVCLHPERIAIDRSIAAGTATFRDISKQHGVTTSALSRHVAQHWASPAVSTPATVANEVVQAVRDQQAKERRQTISVWEQRLHTTYTDVASAYDMAIGDADGIDAAAKFAMVRARLCDTGLRADGVLAGGGETRVTVNVEQLIVLPTPQAPSRPTQTPVTIDVKQTE